jgi:alanyl-tRNA synthetase
MRYRRLEDGSLDELPQRSVDTGMGLERLLMFLQGQPSVYGSDVFEPWMETLPGLWQVDERSMRIVTDHLRSSIVIIGDGVLPSNSGRGYVLRRLIRRVLTILWRDDRTRSLLDMPESLVDNTIGMFGLGPVGDRVREVLRDEEGRFDGLLSRGRKVLSQYEPGSHLSQQELTYLHETHGLPQDLVVDLLRQSRRDHG